MSNLFDTADCFSQIPDYGAYFRSPIPAALDFEIESLLRKWMSLDPVARLSTAAALSEARAGRLLSFSERAASRAVREQSPDHVLVGLVALGVDDWRFDDRENLLVVSLHYDACTRIGAEPKAQFESAAAFLPPRSATGLRAFVKRNERDRSIAAMGYESTVDSDGFRYRRLW